MMTKTSLAALRTGTIALTVIAMAAPAFAQAPTHQHEAQVQPRPDAGQKMPEMKKMMAEKMAAREAAADRLAALMTRMKEATGDAKVAAMADVIAALVEQRAAMEEHCAMMMKMMK